MTELTEKAPEQIWLHEIQWINSGQVETVWRDRRKAPRDVAYVRADLFNSVSKEILTATNELESAQKRIAELEAQIQALRGFARAVLENGIYGFDARRLPDLALVYGLITTKYRAYGPTGNETMHVESYNTELPTGK